MGELGHRAKHRLGHKTERALAAHDEVRENIDRPVIVEQAVHAIAHGVLHRELVFNRGDGCRVAAHTLRQAHEPLVQGGFEGAQPLVGIRCPGVDNRAAGQHHGE